MGALNLTLPVGYVGDLTPGWRVSETASPVDPASDGSGVGIISLSAPRTANTQGMLLRSGTVSHDRLGTISGVIDKVDDSRTGASFDLVPRASLLNVERTVLPVISMRLTSIFQSYLTSVSAALFLSWQATSDPFRTYPGWTGNVLYMLNRLAVANGLELVVSDSAVIVRDLGSKVLDLTDVGGLIVRRTARETARATNVTNLNAVAVPVVGTARKVNYTRDPNCEAISGPDRWYSTWSGLSSSGLTNNAPIAGRFSWFIRIDGYGEFLSMGHRFGEDGYDLTNIKDGGDWAASIKVQASNSRKIAVAIDWLASNSSSIRLDVINGGMMSGTGVLTFETNSDVFGGKPAGAVTAKFMIISGVTIGSGPEIPQIGDVFRIDAAMLTDVLDTTYFDAYTPGAATYKDMQNALGSLGQGISALPTGEATPLWDAYADGNQVLSVNANEISRQTIQTTSTWISLVQPVFGEFTPAAFAGEYVVTDSTRKPLTKAEWQAFGGSVDVRSGKQAGELEVLIVGPSPAIPGAPGPYSLAFSDGQNDYAALSVLGIGVTTRPEIIPILTGADETSTTKDFGPDVASPFIINLQTAYMLGQWAAQYNGGASITLEGTVPTEKLQGFGLTPGALVRQGDCRYRVRTVDITRAGAAIVADWYTTIDDHDNEVVGLTQADLDALPTSERPLDYELSPLRRV